MAFKTKLRKILNKESFKTIATEASF